MKSLKVLVALSVLAVSSASFAKVSYVTGKLSRVDHDKQTISIVKDENGEVVTYRYADEAKYENYFGRYHKLDSLREGEEITLRLEKLSDAEL